jgi:hypothetical protein
LHTRPASPPDARAGVRAERLQAIIEADARAEGVTIEPHHQHAYISQGGLPPAVRAFRDLWISLNGLEGWEANPWVWVVAFERVQPSALIAASDDQCREQVG